MSRRLQVLFDEEEFAEIQRLARRQRMSTAEWVRQSLRAARRAEPRGDAGRKLAVVRAAARHAFPTGDIAQLLSEIERGYASPESA